MAQRFLSSSRYLVLLAVIGAFVAATTLLIYGVVEAFQMVAQTLMKGTISSKGAKALALAFIEVVDLLLLGTVFYIIALGLYELFIDDRVPVPHWLQIHDLDDLKSKLISVVIVVLGVLFLGQVVTWNGERDLLGFGAAIALVIGALTYFLSSKTKKDKTPE
ncbi:MAG TPA: YqhA family protein [Abditibacteriaceae bacterium]|jgi:uncharacterized membrane protein YqhA